SSGDSKTVHFGLPLGKAKHRGIARRSKNVDSHQLRYSGRTDRRVLWLQVFNVAPFREAGRGIARRSDPFPLCAEIKSEKGLQTTLNRGQMWPEPGDLVELLARLVQGRECAAFEFVEFPRLWIVRIFRPSHPDFAYLKVLEFPFCQQEPRNVVPVFVRQNDDVQPFCNRCDVIDDGFDLFGTACNRTLDSTINQHPEVAATVLRKLQQVTVTDTLAVKSYLRFCFGGRNVQRDGQRRGARSARSRNRRGCFGGCPPGGAAAIRRSSTRLSTLDHYRILHKRSAASQTARSTRSLTALAPRSKAHEAD